MDAIDENLFCYLDERERVRDRRRTATSGDVRDIYRTHFFEVSFSGTRWMIPDPFKTTRMSGTLSIKKEGRSSFEQILVTEPIVDQESPQFTERASFRPLTMENSQQYATNSVLRMKVWINGKMHATADLSLAQLLWDQHFDVKIPTYVPSNALLMNSKASPKGFMRLSVIRKRSLEEDFDNHKMSVTFCLSNALCRKISEPRIRIALSIAGERGRWCRVFISGAYAIPFAYGGRLVTTAEMFVRGELRGFSLKNPVRVTIYGLRSGMLRMLGYFQFTFADLPGRKSAPWHGKKLLKTSAIIEYEALPPKGSRMTFTLLRTSQLVRDLLPQENVAPEARNETSSSELQTTAEPTDQESDMSSSTSLGSTIRSRGSSSTKATRRTAVLSKLETVRFPEDGDEEYMDPQIEILQTLTVASAKAVATRSEF